MLRINVVLNYTTAYTAFGVKCLVAPDVPNNAGSLAPIAVSAPEGCLLNAKRPRAVAAPTSSTSLARRRKGRRPTSSHSAPRSSIAAGPARFRPVFDPEVGEFIDVAVHECGALKPGASLRGPAVIVEDETSTVVTRLFDARLDPFGYIELTRRAI
jgi:hypothetical protein